MIERYTLTTHLLLDSRLSKNISTLFLCIGAIATTCQVSANDASARRAYPVQSIERAYSTDLQRIHSDSIIQFRESVWDLDSNTQLGGSKGSENYGVLLDFDRSSRRSLYRLDPGIIEARNPSGEVLFKTQIALSYEPEALLVGNGEYVLNRSNDTETLEIQLELRSIETGELVWRRRSEGNPRWRLSQDTRTVVELISDIGGSDFHTAIAFDTLTQSELDRRSISNLKIRRGSDYLTSLDAAVSILAGFDGTLLANEVSRTLAAIPGFRSIDPLFHTSPKVDSNGNYIILHKHNPTPGEPSWVVFNARNGEQISTNHELGVSQSVFGSGNDPALSPSGELLYQVVGDGLIEVWNPHTKTRVRQLSYSNIPFNILIPSVDDGQLLACALSASNDDFIVLLDTVTNLPLYSKIVNDPDIREPGGGTGFVTGFTRSLHMSPSGSRIYFRTIVGIEAFDYLSGNKIEYEPRLDGKALISRYVESQQCWVTVYQSGKIRMEKPTETTWSQLPNTSVVQYAAIDPESGSIAFQRNRAIFITHPFDERDDQWITDLSLGVYPLRLRGGGEWLAADFRGIYDLDANVWLQLEEELYSEYAIDYQRKRLAMQLPLTPGIVLFDLENASSRELQTGERFKSTTDLCFSSDGETLYCLAQQIDGGFRDQSVYSVDVESGIVEAEIDVSEVERPMLFTQIELHSNGFDLLLASDDGVFVSVDTNVQSVSLPTVLESANSSTSNSYSFDLAPNAPGGMGRYIDIDGHLYTTETSTAYLIPTRIDPSKSNDSLLHFEVKEDGNYWIQHSSELHLWRTRHDTDLVKTWFDFNDRGFFRVYESE